MSLPYDKELYYIESTGTQYIDTNYILSNNQNNRLYIECASTNNNGAYKWIFGSKGGTKQSVFAFANSNGSLYTEIKGSNWTSSDYKFALDSKNVIELDSTSITFNGSPYSHGGSFVYSGVSITIFGCKTSTGLYDNKFIGRIYAAKIYDNDVLVRDYIPVRVGQEGCLYDKVSGEVFRNAGSGSFVLSGDRIFHNPIISNVRRRLLYAKPKKEYNYLCFTALESGTFTLTIDANLATSALQYIEYSLNGNTWVKTDNVNSQSVTITTPTIANGGKVYWRGIGNQLANNFSGNPSIFSSTCRFDASGEVMSLLKGENFTKNRNVGNSAFARLFKDCSTIVNAKDLTIEVGTIGSYGLQEMFINCTSLITTPYINDFNGAYAFSGMFKGCSSLVEVTYPLPVPSTVSNRAYRNMFEGCTALVKTPNLPLTDFGNNAYMNMFKGCTSLTTISTLPATSLTDSCYKNMFDGCTSLVDAPFLPATNITGSAYSAMFAGCTNLKNVPDINVSSFAGTYNMSLMFYNCSSLVHCPIKSVPNDAPVQCFNSMFRGCTNLVDAFELPALVLNIYSYGSLFRDTKVSYIKMLATDISANGCLGSWVSRVPSSGIFVKNINATWTNVGESGVPSGWTIIYYDPTDDKYYTDQTKATECDDHGNPI